MFLLALCALVVHPLFHSYDVLCTMNVVRFRCATPCHVTAALALPPSSAAGADGALRAVAAQNRAPLAATARPFGATGNLYQGSGDEEDEEDGDEGSDLG